MAYWLFILNDAEIMQMINTPYPVANYIDYVLASLEKDFT